MKYLLAFVIGVPLLWVTYLIMEITGPLILLFMPVLLSRGIVIAIRDRYKK